MMLFATRGSPLFRFERLTGTRGSIYFRFLVTGTRHTGFQLSDGVQVFSKGCAENGRESLRRIRPVKMQQHQMPVLKMAKNESVSDKSLTPRLSPTRSVFLTHRVN